MDKNEPHLDVYGNRSELYHRDSPVVFLEGRQSEKAIARNQKISQAFKDGFYSKVMRAIQSGESPGRLDDKQSSIIRALVNGVTSEVGRALVGLSCLQLAIKCIEPTQSVRLHKGGTRDAGFSWQEGISMRTLDKKYNTPFLRQYGLLRLNADGIMMTRSLAENYPYSRLYKAEMRGPMEQWIAIVEAVESGNLPPCPALCLLLSLLKNNSDEFAKKAGETINLAKRFDDDFNAVVKLLTGFCDTTTYSARAFEVVIHGFMQAYCDMGFAEGALVPLSQMRSANKKHGNVGDIELKQGDQIIESWDAKYGKPYLRDELEELNDKLKYQNVDVAGFIVNTAVMHSAEIVARADEIAGCCECKVYLLSLEEWIAFKTEGLNKEQLNELGKRWLLAVVESFGQKRPELAPIDEPCDGWLDNLRALIAPNVR